MPTSRLVALFCKQLQLGRLCGQFRCQFVLNSTEGVDGGNVMTGFFWCLWMEWTKPYHSINFVTVHDGFTMYDLFSYEERQNDCGLLNPICCDDPFSAWCDTESGEEHNNSYNWMQRNHETSANAKSLCGNDVLSWHANDSWWRRMDAYSIRKQQRVFYMVGQRMELVPMGRMAKHNTKLSF